MEMLYVALYLIITVLVHVNITEYLAQRRKQFDHLYSIKETDDSIITQHQLQIDNLTKQLDALKLQIGLKGMNK